MAKSGNKWNGSVKWIVLAITLAGMIFGFGQKSKGLEKDDEANATAITALHEHHVEDMVLVRDDLKIIMADVKLLLQKE